MRKTLLRFERQAGTLRLSQHPFSVLALPSCPWNGTTWGHPPVVPSAFSCVLVQLCSPYPLPWGYPVRLAGGVLSEQTASMPCWINMSVIRGLGWYVEERENLIFIKASIKRKKSHSGNIKYSGVRPIRRFYTGHALRQSCWWGSRRGSLERWEKKQGI